jgi:hypothetical protein
MISDFQQQEFFYAETLKVQSILELLANPDLSRMKNAIANQGQSRGGNEKAQVFARRANQRPSREPKSHIRLR